MTSVDIDEAVAERAEAPQAEAVVPGLGNTVATFVLAGASNANQKLLRITGLRLTTAVPAVVQLQPRQSDNRNLNFPDQFAVQVITTAQDNILCLIRRLDLNAGWGQNLRLDIFIVDRVVNP